MRGDSDWLQAENPAFGNIELNEDSGLEVWGVIAKSIRNAVIVGAPIALVG